MLEVPAAPLLPPPLLRLLPSHWVSSKDRDARRIRLEGFEDLTIAAPLERHPELVC